CLAGLGLAGGGHRRIRRRRRGTREDRHKREGTNEGAKHGSSWYSIHPGRTTSENDGANVRISGASGPAISYTDAAVRSAPRRAPPSRNNALRSRCFVTRTRDFSSRIASRLDGVPGPHAILALTEQQ